MNTIHFDKFFDVLIISFSGEVPFVIFRGEAGREAGRWEGGAHREIRTPHYQFMCRKGISNTVNIALKLALKLQTQRKVCKL